MTDLVTMVTGALVSKSVEAAAAGAADAVRELVRLVRERFSRDRGRLRALEAALADPSDPRALEALARVLGEAVREDSAFAEQLRRWRSTAAGMAQVEGDGVVNVFSGSAERVLQARDVHGDVSF